LGIGWVGLFILILVTPQFSFLAPLRLILGLPFVLVLPGYWLSVVLFPRKDDIEYVVRITLVFGLSLAVLPALAFLLNILPWGINLWSVFIGLSLICFLSAFVALFRRGNIPTQERFQLVQRIELRNWWAELDRRERMIYQFISLVLVLAIIVTGSVFVLPNRAERLTEFYLLGTSGLADSYPWGGEPGESFAVNIGIVNHESKPVTYRVEVKDGDEVIGSIAPTELKSGEKLEQNLVFRPITTGNNIPVYFLLYRGGDQSPYRTLRLWLDVGVSSD
jgi:uncharacterized membrane protein